MNDNPDLEARLHAGPHTFPPAPTPQSRQLRDVLTASRRRSRHAQASVVACATVAVASGAALVMRDPQSAEPLEMGTPGATGPGSTEPAAGLAWAADFRELVCDPDRLPSDEQLPPAAVVLQLRTNDGSPLPADVTMAIDGETFYSTDPDHPPLPPAYDELRWVLEFPLGTEGSEAARVAFALSPFEAEGHELSVTSDGDTFRVVGFGGDRLPGHMSLDGLSEGTPGAPLDIAWAPLDAICAGGLPTDAETTTSR